MNATTLAGTEIRPVSSDTVHWNVTGLTLTPEEVDFSEQFSTYRTKVLLWETHSPVIYENHPDRADLLYRFAGALSVRPWDKTFVLRMWPGSTRDDVREMEDIVAKVKAGYLGRIPFDEEQSTVEARGTYWRIVPGFAVSIGEPARQTWPDFVIACDDIDCDDQVHYTDELLDPYVVHSKNIGLGRFHLERVSHQQNGSGWAVSGDDIEVELLSAKEAINLANDLRWAAAEASKLNERNANVK